MVEGLKLQRLRFLRRRKRTRDPLLFLNDAPRSPPISQDERLSDASSIDLFDCNSDLRTSKASLDCVCLICLDDMPIGTKRTTLPCNHAVWHTSCIARWLSAYARCPLCNSQVACTKFLNRHGYGSASSSSVSQDLSWLLLERRLSLVSRPANRHVRRFSRTTSTRR